MQKQNTKQNKNKNKTKQIQQRALPYLKTKTQTKPHHLYILQNVSETNLHTKKNKQISL